LGRGPPRHHKDVEVTIRSQSTKRGGAVEIGAHDIRPKHLVYQGQDLGDLRLRFKVATIVAW